jgi:hypothetical protein
MKSIVLLVVLFMAAASGHAQATLADLSVMAGCWELRDDSKNLLISEQWMSPAGTSILGMGRTVKGGKTTDWEFMRVEQRQDRLFFVARPKANSEETAFKLISSLRGRFVFENKLHDFPQRVIYTVTDSTLTGRVEGESEGKSKGFDFRMKSVKCR